MNITLIGCGGFLGAAITRQLLEAKHSVRVLTRTPRPGHKTLAAHPSAKSLKYFYGNLSDTNQLEDVIKSADALIYLVSISHPGQNPPDNVRALKEDAKTAQLVFSLCGKHSVKKVLFSSSGGAIYGIRPDTPFHEDMKPNPISEYGRAKALTEDYLASHAQKNRFDYTILRIGNIYGENQNAIKGHGVVGAWIYRLVRQQPIPVWNNTQVIRDYVYVEDAARAFLLALSKKVAPKIFNVGSGIGTSLEQLLTILKNHSGTALPMKIIPAPYPQITQNVLDIGLIQKYLGWRNNVPLDEGIAKTWAWFNREHRQEKNQNPLHAY